MERVAQSQYFRRNLGGLTPQQRHVQLVQQALQQQQAPGAASASYTETDYDALRKHHRFLRGPEDDAAAAADSNSWGARLARRYYARLFKEYAIADLSRYKESKIGLRWRTQAEVVAGTGQFTCGAKGCGSSDGLCAFEVNFAYSEDGQAKQALVKLCLCEDCAMRLNYRRDSSRQYRRLGGSSAFDLQQQQQQQQRQREEEEEQRGRHKPKRSSRGRAEEDVRGFTKEQQQQQRRPARDRSRSRSAEGDRGASRRKGTSSRGRSRSRSREREERVDGAQHGSRGSKVREAVSGGNRGDTAGLPPPPPAPPPAAAAVPAASGSGEDCSKQPPAAPGAASSDRWQLEEGVPGAHDDDVAAAGRADAAAAPGPLEDRWQLQDEELNDGDISAWLDSLFEHGGG